MVAGRVHYEVFGRRKQGSGWVLELATEDRAAAAALAQDLMDARGYAAAKVTKEVLDEESREFSSVAILSLGEAGGPEKDKPRRFEPLCIQPQDLYTLHARERIGRLLAEWLERHRATPFELLHRADLAEALEASEGVLLHAIQKVSIPEATERRVSVHELIRDFQALVDRAVARLARDQQRGLFPDLSRERFAVAAERALAEPEPGYVLGGAVAAAIASARTWSEKVMRLLDLADAAPPDGPARKLAMNVLEQPLAEILGVKPGLADLIGQGLDLGAELAALTRLTAADAVGALIRRDIYVAKMMPPLAPAAERGAGWRRSPSRRSAPGSASASCAS